MRCALLLVAAGLVLAADPPLNLRRQLNADPPAIDTIDTVDSDELVKEVVMRQTKR